MKLNIISMTQLREDFNQVRQRLMAGEELLLVYRSQPLATINPVKKKASGKNKKAKLKTTKEIKNWLKNKIRPLKLGGHWTPQSLNQTYDRQYQQMLP